MCADNINKNVLTIATGKKLYVDMAVNLARSFIWWNKNSDISFYIVTDQPNYIAQDVLEFAKVIEIEAGAYGLGFSSKLYLDKFAPSGQTLFIDSDCLIFGKLNTVFEKFTGKKVSVIGTSISKGEWFGNVEEIIARFNLPYLSKFNGGIYYIENGEVAAKVYDTARALEKKYDEIGFVRLRGRPNDEVIMSVAMQLHQMEPIADDATIMSDPQACPGKYEIDVIKGVINLQNPPTPDPKHQNWYPFYRVSPLVLHFLGYFTQHHPYKREVFRLEKVIKDELNWRTELIAKLTIDLPELAKNTFKDTLRPVYRILFGTRKIPKSERIV